MSGLFQGGGNDFLRDITDAIGLTGDVDDPDPIEPEEVLDQGGEPDIGDQKIFAPKSLTGEIDLVKGVPIIYGRVRTNGIIVFKELVEGSQESFFDKHKWYLVYALCEGTTNGLAGVWVDEKYTETYPITIGPPCDMSC